MLLVFRELLDLMIIYKVKFTLVPWIRYLSLKTTLYNDHLHEQTASIYLGSLGMLLVFIKLKTLLYWQSTRDSDCGYTCLESLDCMATNKINTVCCATTEAQGAKVSIATLSVAGTLMAGQAGQAGQAGRLLCHLKPQTYT
jgi:hypothetical protein